MSLRRNLALSLVFHVALVCLLLLFRQWFPPSETVAKKDWTWIELDPGKVIPKPKTKDEATKNQRIVQTEAGQKADQAAPDAFLGERTQTVDRQMIAQQTELGKVGSKQKSAQAQPQKPKTQAARKTEANERMKKFDLSRLGLPILPPPTQEMRDQAVNEQMAQAPVLSQDDLSGEVPAHEYVKGFKTGERTLLNTKEYVFFGYFQRIRERLEMHWGPMLRAQLNQMYNSGRGLASDSEHTTRLLVTLNAQGEIVRVQMMEESGVKDLDEAAVRAFNQAGPFPNPPKGIVDADGKVQLRWDFILKT